VNASRAWPIGLAPLVAAATAGLAVSVGKPRRGAAIEDERGVIHTGTAIQIMDAPSASICAERIAISAMCVSGARRPRRIIIIGPEPDGAPPPCGGCLQSLLEFSPDADVRWGTPAEERGRGRVSKLLPAAFRDYRA
jgi:cytidine deaminase